MKHVRHIRFLCFSLAWLVLASSASAQAPAPQPAGEEQQKQKKGFTLWERFDGSSNAEGQVMTLTSSVGYDFNKYFGVEAGVPVYFVRSTSAVSGTTSSSGIGNFYAGLRLSLANPVVNYSSSLTGSAPTGATSRGRSTGRANVDWTNHFDRDFGRWTPFADLGVGNSIPDTRFFRRPFITLGKVAHFEAGTSYNIWRSLDVSVSAYDVAPWGQQKIYSRLLRRQAGITGGPGTSRRGRVFESSALTVGGAVLARDNGFNVGFTGRPASFLELGLGYSRSVHFRLDTVSFGLGLNLSSLLRKKGVQ